MTKHSIRVLIVEDEVRLAESVFDFLEPQGYVVDHAADGVSGLHLAVVNDYDVIILDINLPGMSGLDICSRLRNDANKATPILMMTAKDTLLDKLEGFQRGTDDYLVKPFDLRELEARIRALCTRKQGRERVLTVGDLTFDLGRVVITRADKTIKLNKIGSKLLEQLMRSYPNVVSRNDMESLIWGDDPPDNDALRSHIYALRQALDIGHTHKMIETVHGHGYKLIKADS